MIQFYRGTTTLGGAITNTRGADHKHEECWQFMMEWLAKRGVEVSAPILYVSAYRDMYFARLRPTSKVTLGIKAQVTKGWLGVVVRGSPGWMWDSHIEIDIVQRQIRITFWSTIWVMIVQLDNWKVGSGWLRGAQAICMMGFAWV